MIVNDAFSIISKGAFTLARFRGRFRTKLAHLEMKKKYLLKQNVQAYCEIAREIRKCKLSISDAPKYDVTSN